MNAERFELSDGYEGDSAQNRSIGGIGENVSGIAKKQFGQAAELQGSNHGALASQAVNGSNAAGNNMNVNATMHSSNAAGGQRDITRVAGAEDEAASAQRTESTALDQQAIDLMSKINHA